MHPEPGPQPGSRGNHPGRLLNPVASLSPCAATTKSESPGRTKASVLFKTLVGDLHALSRFRMTTSGTWVLLTGGQRLLGSAFRCFARLWRYTSYLHFQTVKPDCVFAVSTNTKVIMEMALLGRPAIGLHKTHVLRSCPSVLGGHFRKMNGWPRCHYLLTSLVRLVFSTQISMMTMMLVIMRMFSQNTRLRSSVE